MSRLKIILPGQQQCDELEQGGRTANTHLQRSMSWQSFVLGTKPVWRRVSSRQRSQISCSKRRQKAKETHHRRTASRTFRQVQLLWQGAGRQHFISEHFLTVAQSRTTCTTSTIRAFRLAIPFFWRFWKQSSSTVCGCRFFGLWEGKSNRVSGFVRNHRCKAWERATEPPHFLQRLDALPQRMHWQGATTSWGQARRAVQEGSREGEARVAGTLVCF